MKKKTYLAPEVKTVECKMTNIICASGQTEGFKVIKDNPFDLGEDAWG